MKSGAETVAAARALIGVHFRPQGRTREGGLDCVGLAAAAIGRSDVQTDYDLRTGSTETLERGLRAAGLVPEVDRAPGDLLVMLSGPGQLHLGIWAGDGTVHADARLRRVVERPGEPPWPVIGAWRPSGRRT